MIFIFIGNMTRDNFLPFTVTPAKVQEREVGFLEDLGSDECQEML